MALSKALLLVLLYASCVSASGGNRPGASQEEYIMTEKEEICAHAMHMCHEHHAPHVQGHIAPMYTPAELHMLCMNHNFIMCMREVKGNCSEMQLLKIDSIVEAQEYICSRKGMKAYSEGAWESLGHNELYIENDLCTSQFQDGAVRHLREFMRLDAKERPDDMEEKDELLEDIEDEREACCGHFYAYLSCVEDAVSRQTDDKLGEWQYEVMSKFYTPQYETCECKIGKGISKIFINAMIIVGALLGFIFGLAALCGITDCCALKMKLCRRRCRQICYCCYDFEEDDEYFERKYEAKLNALYGEDNEAYDRKSFPA